MRHALFGIRTWAADGVTTLLSQVWSTSLPRVPRPGLRPVGMGKEKKAVKADETGTDMVDLLGHSGAKFNDYLQAYSAASVALLGRWPTFVPEEERYRDTLVPGSEAAERVFGDSEEVTTEEAAQRGLFIDGIGSKRGGPSPAFSVPTPPPHGPTPPPQHSRPSSQGSKRAAADVAAKDAKVAALTEKLEMLSTKLRHEVTERTKANEENMRRGQQLQTTQRDCSALQETVRRQAQQLEHARDVTLKLEEDHRAFVDQVKNADKALVKERKLRHTWQLRAEKYERRITPLEAEAGVLRESLDSTVVLLEQAQSRGSGATGRVAELASTNTRLSKMTDSALKEANTAREDRAHAGLQLSLMADRRDELLDTIEKLKADADEHAAALDAMEDARNKAVDIAQEERRLRSLSDGAMRKAEGGTMTAMEELRAWREKAEAVDTELNTQKQHVQALLTQDAVRESEQRKLFESVSELLARVQYLGEFPPERMGMCKAEALQHRDEAMRHLRALREAHALSTFPPQLVLNPSTVAHGSAMLSSVSSIGGGAPTPHEDARAAMSPRTRTQAAVQGTYVQRLDATSSRPKGGLYGRPRPSPRPSPRPNLLGRTDASVPSEPSADWEKKMLLDVMGESHDRPLR